MKTEYNGVEIEYVESDNKWRFTLHGRERSASSLTLAKQAIDKGPKPKTKFEPIPAWLWNYSGPKKVTIASLAENSRYSRAEAWVTRDGRRSKEGISDLYADNLANQPLVDEWLGLQKDLEAASQKIGARQDEIVKALQRVDLSSIAEVAQ